MSSCEKILDEFVEIYADRIKYDEDVQYVDSSEYVAISRESAIRLAKKIVNEIKTERKFKNGNI